MTAIQKIFAVVLLCAFSAGSLAQGKVVIVDIQTAMLSTNVAQKELEKLDKNPEFAALKAKSDGLVADLKKLQATVEKDGLTWSAEQQAEHRKKVEYVRADYELVGKKLQAEQQAVMQRILQELSGKTHTVLEQLIAADNIGLVLHSQAAIHASAAHNITPKLTELLNKAK